MAGKVISGWIIPVAVVVRWWQGNISRRVIPAGSRGGVISVVVGRVYSSAAATRSVARKGSILVQ